MLALNKKVGLLSIQGNRLAKVLYFDHRGVTVHHNVHRVLDRVLAAFVRTGRLAEASVDEVRDHAARSGQPLLDCLLAGGYLQPAELEEQYRTELEEEVYDLFFCKEARFEFHENIDHLEGSDGAVDERFFFNCDSVIMEAARRIDEWAYISERVPTTAEVFVAVVDAIDADGFGPDGPGVFQLLDGRRNVARLVEISGLSTFQVCKVLSQLADGGAIGPVAPEELVPQADACLAEGRLQDAINLYERAVVLGMGLPEVHSLAAGAYQAAEQYENAVYHLECEAEFRVAAGDAAGASSKLLEAVKLLPTDLRARERLIELVLGDPPLQVPGFDPLAEGKHLVDLLLGLGDVARVRSLLERLLVVAPTDPDLKKALVNVHIKAGDQKRVVELYESIADDLVRQHRPLEAVGYLQKILLIDRSRADISERVRQLYESDERSRRRGRALAALAVVFCLLLVLGSGYWFYNKRAEEDFSRIDVHEALAREDFAGASTAYTEFVASHPLTTAVARAESELQQIEAARQRFEARRATERAGKEREQQRARAEYKVEWARQRELFLAGKPEEALEALARVRDLVAKADSPEDMAWALEQQVERTWMRLRDHLDAAAKLAAGFEAKLLEGDWQQARELSLQLHGEFDATQAAARVAIPVMVRTRPAGARLLHDGRPLEHVVEGRNEPLRTPAVVLCPAGTSPWSVVAQLDGFEPKSVAIDARKDAELDVVLEVVAARRIAFQTPVQTGVGIGEGWIAAGVRGGRVGVCRIDGSSNHLVELNGLKAVDSTPIVQSGRVFFTTNENTLECLTVDTAAPVPGWPVTVPGGASTEPVVNEGRVAVVDREFVLHCWEQATGVELWTVSLDSSPSGPPTIDRRQVVVGTQDGRVLVVDAADGKVVSLLRCPAGVTTRVLADRGTGVFGCADGNVRAVDLDEGKVLWTVGVGHALADGELVLGADRVIAIEKDGQLVALARRTGLRTGQLALDGAAQRGLRVQGDRLFVVVRRAKTRQLPAHDVLQAISLGSMALLWEYVDQGLSPGAVGIDALNLAWPTSAGEVVLFR